jgi:hypothetical protein
LAGGQHGHVRPTAFGKIGVDSCLSRDQPKCGFHALWWQHHAADWAQMKIHMDEATLANGDINKVPRSR